MASQSKHGKLREGFREIIAKNIIHLFTCSYNIAIDLPEWGWGGGGYSLYGSGYVYPAVFTPPFFRLPLSFK